MAVLAPFTLLFILAGATVPPGSPAAAAEVAAEVAALDSRYQAAVKANDADTMGRLLADDFVLVLGDGRTFDREALLAEARRASRTYERQDELARDVRVWGDTAVVTAKLWLKGSTREGERFDYMLWFSDTWVRQQAGWRYVLGQASLRLPPSPAPAERLTVRHHAAISDSISSALRARASVSTAWPSRVMHTSSSMRMPMPRHRASTLVSSGEM